MYVIKVLIPIFLTCLMAGAVSSIFIKFNSENKSRSFRLESSETPIFFYNTIGNSPTASEPQLNEEKKQSPKRITLEIASVSSRAEAELIINKLNSSGLPAFITPVQSASGKVNYKVRSGLFKDPKSAQGAQKVLEARTKLKGKMTKL